MGTECLSGHDARCGQPEIEDHTLLEEIQFLGAVIAEVEGCVNHLSRDEVDQVLEHADAMLSGRPQSGGGPCHDS